MNKKVFTLLSATVLVAALAVPLSAQTFTLTANIPFAFTVGNKTLPAGEYMIRNNFDTPYVLVFRGENHKGDAAGLADRETVVRTDHPAAATELTFNHYGNRYFLSEVVDGYTLAGFVFPMTRTEREMAKTASAERHVVPASPMKG